MLNPKRSQQVVGNRKLVLFFEGKSGHRNFA